MLDWEVTGDLVTLVINQFRPPVTARRGRAEEDRPGRSYGLSRKPRHRKRPRQRGRATSGLPRPVLPTLGGS